MVYKHFRLICILRVTALCATTCLFFFLIYQTTYYATLVIVGAWALYQTYALIHYVERTNRDLTRFLQAIRYEDFSQSFTGTGLGSAYNDLKEAFNEVLDAFRKTRAEKEEHFRYLHTVVQHVGIGLICFNPNGRIELINTAAQRLFKTPHIRNIKDLEIFSKPLVETLLKLRAGDKCLVKVEDNDELLQLIVYATELRMRSETFILVSVQNIQSELEEQEMEAWQKLIRVLTHEIMNSITPISSLASTVRGLIPDPRATTFQTDTLPDVHAALETIQNRSQGLLHFVETYRQLTRIPKPDFQIFPIAELFAHVAQLLKPDIESNHIALHTAVAPETLELTADPDLVQQVLINLIRNSVQALNSRPNARINLTAQLDRRGRVVIRITDNGPGILEDVQERIFIPFFTTKRDGSGIGLSLSRQIMRQHRGTISVQSKPEEETVFTLRF